MYVFTYYNKNKLKEIKQKYKKMSIYLRDTIDDFDEIFKEYVEYVSNFECKSNISFGEEKKYPTYEVLLAAEFLDDTLLKGI
ncbi:MAG: hypothetical protein LBD75_00230 [Candidatus Peribacteria bacterium]|jgi:hypothetical protein|nr:hypothetical protein [Candidatus Peribacteria bacterium]